MTVKHYATPSDFKQALEQRLKSQSTQGADFARRRQLVVFHRLLARIFSSMSDVVILKGGLVLDLRLENARTTKDVDLRMTGPNEHVLEQLRVAGRIELGDFMLFEIRPDTDHPEIKNDGMKYDGLRFRAECKLAGKRYGDAFGVDVAFADPMLGPPDTIEGDDVLGFAGIAPPKIRVYPIETHIAEKLHAYTMPRPRENSRVKDLPDIALLASIGAIDGRRLRGALEQTFSFRATHALPDALPLPPTKWSAPYARMATENSLPWSSIEDVARAAGSFINPVLSGDVKAVWAPVRWAWEKNE